jgi:glycosyltransferase involved in cell wall biosynthesis
MRILLHTLFYPNLGGIETVAWLLAREWDRSGARVTVVSDVVCEPAQRHDFPFPVHYRPNPAQWLRLIREADVFVHMNISLKALWPLFLVRRPFVAVNHTYYHSDRSGYRDWRERLKLRVMARAANIAVSESVAQRLPVRCVVIPNPVDLSLFQISGYGTRTKDLVFLGRLVSDKGCDLLIESMKKLADSGIRPALTVIGRGPERPVLERLVASLDLQKQVAFAGAPSSEEVAKLLRQHRIMVVPSIWEESFGIVALEGAACGCVVLGSDGGGLPEAIGPCGVTFRRGDVSDLAVKLGHLLDHPDEWEQYQAAAQAHLELHSPARAARCYMEVFERALLQFPGEVPALKADLHSPATDQRDSYS